MSSDDVFNDFVRKVLMDYSCEYKVAPVNIDYRIVDDMCAAYTELRPEHAEKTPEKIAQLANYNGCMVIPRKLDEPFSVLLNRGKLLEYIAINNKTWIGTIIHETTHVLDYIEYAKIINTDNYDDLLSIDDHKLFHLWTESNAKAKGYYFVRKYTYDDVRDREQLKYVFEKELPYLVETMHTDYHSTQDGMQQAYHVSHFIGRLFTLQQLFPLDFTDQEIERLFNQNYWMYDWFVFFRENQELINAYNHFEEFRTILNRNFKGF